ncbi:enoyl-CoA hydratase/isomerase family protein [Marinobacter caseinilyticus]|uniref:enoyl-CoA hydratase/isomerase family protein n=1 Tax=Marinobacter caseinilyticus TaxID=2692195 RepID=UPI00140B616D|nr:enoyl-CoA hydratase/isomerase family protein [Marinobacter caseinilyticus]
MTNQPVFFEEIATADGCLLGVARLQVPRAMNALSLEMIKLLERQLALWADNEAVVAVWLEGDGDKAFCAGGDVVALYRDMTEPRPDHRSASEGETFFTLEYELDQMIHNYAKPLIVWGNGIVMGGGMGLMVGASHRVVTERSRLAMPEVTIGLYPDVGAGWFLNRMPGRTGLFLGLTGAHIKAADALFVGLADRFICHERKMDVLQALQQAHLSDAPHAGVNKVLRQFESQSREALPDSEVRNHFDDIQALTDADTLVEVVSNLKQASDGDAWLAKAVASLASASPTSLAILWQHLQSTRHDSLSEVFAKELSLSIRCLKKGEFAEGIRALLIDKDRNPRWHCPSLEDVSPAWMDEFFT